MRLLRLPDRRFDAGVAVVLLVAGEIELIARGYTGQQLWLTLGMLTITIPLAWRRRAPLLVTCVVMTALVVLRAISAEFHSLTVPVFALFIPPYTVAAYEPGARALLGLIVCLAAAVVMHLITTATASWAFVIGAPSAKPTQVTLRFREHDVELTVSQAAAASSGWPTVAMRERATLCEGELEVNITGNDEQLIVRLPREFEGALA